jgi:MFS family permease
MHEASLAGQGGGRASAAPGAGYALALLIAINLFNYIDRQVLAAVEPEIRATLLAPGDPNAQGKMGLLSSAFLLSYMGAAPLFGWLAGRYARWLLIAIGVLLWTVASGASGLALTFWMLLITRCFVGVGEGAYGPVAPTLLSDLYPVATRGRVMAWFYMAIPFGGALGYALGGQINAIAGWRWAFYVVVPPGVLLGVWALLMRDPPQGAADALTGPPKRATLWDCRVLIRTPSFVLNTLGMTAMSFAIGALAFWLPAYLKCEKVGAVYGIEPTTVFGLITAAGGLTATLAGGMAGDALRGRFSGSYFLVSGAGLLISAPGIALFLCVPFPWAWIFVFVTVFFLFFNTGPTNTILANVSHPAMRATAFAVNILAIHLLGDVISPPLVGTLADRLNRHEVVRLVSVDQGSPAARAGLAPGDEILAVGRTPTRLAVDLDRLIEEKRPGETVQIHRRRAGEETTLDVTLAAAAPKKALLPDRARPKESPGWLGAEGQSGNKGLVAGFLMVSAFMVLGACFWLWGARYLAADTAAAPHRLDGTETIG